MKPNHDPEKLLELFRKSKTTVQKFVDQFQQSHGRKPRGEDLDAAPEYVKVCIKNCKKIKIHLAKLETSPPKEEPKNVVEEPKKIVQETTKIVEKPKREVLGPISQPKKSKSNSAAVWGSHLNRSNSDSYGGSSSKNNEFLERSSSFSGTLSALIIEDLAKTTRKNLNFRRPNTKTAFFETMGDESTLQGLMDATETTIGGVHDNAASQKIDPLVLFHPELSMDGLSQHGQQKAENLIRDEDCEIEALAQNVKTTKVQTNKKEGKSMNFLSSNIKLKRTTEAKERVFNEEVPLSFAGLFSKPSDENATEDDTPTLDDEENDENNTTMKRKSEMGHEEESNAKRQKLSSQELEEEEISDEVFDDENVDSSNIPQEDQLLPYDPKAKYNEDDENKSNVKQKKKYVPKKLQGMCSNNFVKIDLKKKNYVRGSNKMTGAKYKRQEWKRKAQGKFGRNAK